MGHDEHGPAYPAGPYRCGVCRTGDRDSFLRCNHPMCPDGRDQYDYHVAEAQAGCDKARAEVLAELRRPPDRLHWAIVLSQWAFLLAFLLSLFWPRPAPAMDHGFDPNNATVKWFESIQRPNMPGSCCGKGDAYPVEDYWPNGDGSFTAKIGDGSAIKYPDGTTREYIASGTEVLVPAELVNKLEDDQDNPTDVSWVFMTVHAAEVGTIYCLIRHPQGG